MPQDFDPLAPRRWRPQPLWVPAGLVLGALCGGAAAALLMTTVPLLNALLGGGFPAEPTAAGFLWVAVIYGMYGGTFGAVAGLIVGIVMTFFGGSNLPEPRARERAFLVTLVATGLILFGFFVPFLGFYPGAIVIAFLAPLAGGSLSYWLAPKVTV